LNEFNNKIETPLSTAQNQGKKLFHHEIHSGKLYPNSWRIKSIATTPKKKAQNGDVEMHGQNYYKT
jgi:hypothetical protein